MLDALDHNTIDYLALGVAVAIFLVTLGVVLLLRRLGIMDSVAFVVLILLPVAFYGAASGYIQEIAAPGGWALTFREVADDPVKGADELVTTVELGENVEEISRVEKGGVGAIERYRQNLAPGDAIAVTLTLGETFYTQKAIAAYLRAFLALDPQLTVMFLDGEGDFAGSAPAQSVLAQLEYEMQTGGDSPFLDAVAEADAETPELEALRQLVALTTESVTSETTNVAALKLMLEEGVDTLVAVDRQGRPSGIVQRDAIVTRLMVKLAAD